MKRFYFHLMYDDHTLIDDEGQLFDDRRAARDEATVSLMEMWVNHGADTSLVPDAIAVAPVDRERVTVIRVNSLKQTFRLSP